MDSFDDLLAPSRHALEDNPFADPFAKPRSSSPDPWATPFAATDSHEYGNTSQHFNSLDSLSNDKYDEFKLSDGDPMNSPGPAHAADDDDNEPLGRTRSPGFRESIGVSFLETATIRPEILEDYPSFPSTTSPTRSDHDNLSPSTHSGSVTSDTQKTSMSSLGSTTFSSPPPSATDSNSSFLSPLESPSTGVERSIMGLSLGGETLGWQAETQTPWQSEHEHPISIPTKLAHSDEDSDDDKPIMQTLKHHDPDDSVPVSVHTPFVSYSLLICTSQKAIRNDKGIQPVFMITVDDPQKVGDPIRSFTMYTVHTRVTLFFFHLHLNGSPF